ncbi:hypothetical protein HIM_11053 [Hirsutella minnesotensis 3608]|uniref:FAD-binding domain-containing protein n=1 Tax=Hirsutella minnesotensis 3608 TaxID=1043627 RepID=A0A0F7ZJD7_9HYPO|nr:hypothetical protein HIM_11053 [Hirsutella minnesotensis 3608]
MPHVLIVGAGIAGLSAAISLRRAGHTVHIYERSSMNHEIGAAINIPPNASRVLMAWGLDPFRWQFVKARLLTYQDPFTLEKVADLANEKTASSLGGAELYYAHRVDLHNALKWLATQPGGPGTPVKIHMRSEVESYDPYAPSITLRNGQQICGDLVVGADGVHSSASGAVQGHKNDPVPPVHSNSCYRFLIPAATLEDDPETRFWNQDCNGWARVLAHNKTGRRIFTYTCRDNSIHNFVGIFYDNSAEYEKREAADWQASVDVSDVLDRFSDFDPRILKIISKATEVKRWPLLYRNPISCWYRGRMALAGDSAHPMLPHQGQGGAQGIEDGLALGIVMHGATTPAEIEKRLDVYDKVRRNRASVIQVLSNVGQDQSKHVREELLHYMSDKKLPTNPLEILKHNFGYDIIDATVKAMRERDSTFQLPDDFFSCEVVGVPLPPSVPNQD